MTQWQMLWPSLVVLALCLTVLGVAAGVHMLTKHVLDELKDLTAQNRDPLKR